MIRLNVFIQVSESNRAAVWKLQRVGGIFFER